MAQKSRIKCFAYIAAKMNICTVGVTSLKCKVYSYTFTQENSKQFPWRYFILYSAILKIHIPVYMYFVEVSMFENFWSKVETRKSTTVICEYIKQIGSVAVF